MEFKIPICIYTGTLPIYIQTRRLFWFTYLTDWDTLCDINIYPSNHVGDISNSFESAAQWY